MSTTVPGEATPKHAAARKALGTHATRAAFWNTVLLPAKLASHLLAQLVLANALPKAEFGVYVLALSVGITSGAVVDLGTERSVVKFLPEVAGREGRRGVRKLLTWVFGFKMAVLLPIIALATVLHTYFFRYLDSRIPADQPDVAGLVSRQHWTLFITVVSLVLVGAFYDVAMQSLVATFRNKSWNVITIVVTLLDPLTVAFIILAGGNIGVVLIGRVAVALAATVLAGGFAIVAVRQSADEEQIHVAEEEHNRPLPVRRFVLYSGFQYLLQISAFLTSYAFAVLILRTADEAAGYRIASGSVQEILVALMTPIVGIQVPIFARIFTARDDRQIDIAYGLLTRFLALILFPGAIGLALLVPNLFRIVYPQYETFAAVCIVLVLGRFAEAALSTGTTVLLTYERYVPVIAARLVALAALPVMFFTVRAFGPMGVAATTGGFAVLSALVGTIASNVLLPIRYPLGFARRVGIAVAIMAAIVGPLAFTVARPPADTGTFLHRIAWSGATGIVALLGGLAYVVAFRMLGGIEPADLERLRTLRFPMRGLALRLLGGARP